MMLVRLHVTADSITIAGCLGSCIVGIVVGAGQLTVGGVAFLLVSALDFFDGAVARATGTARPFGAFLDSVLDRLAEAGVLVGISYYFASHAQPLEATVANLALVGSFGVSYARARAEGLGYDCAVGLFQRPERVLLLGIGLILQGPVLLVVLAVLTVLTFVTVIQRSIYVAGAMRARSNP